MRFSVEQIFLTDSSGRPLTEKAVAYHVVEAEALDSALTRFLGEQQADLVGDVQRFSGTRAMATAKQLGTVFTLHVEPGSDSFQHERRASRTDRTVETGSSTRDSGRLPDRSQP